MDISQRLIIPAHVTYQSLDGEAVILNLESEQYFGLDKLGTRVWQEIAAGSTLEQIYTNLLETYDVEPESLRGDLGNLLTDLVEQGLLEVVIE